MKQIFIVQKLSDLKKISQEINFLGIKKYDLQVAFDFLTEEENHNIEIKIKKYYAVCGCQEGRSAGVITLIIFITLLLTGFVSVSAIGILKTILLYFTIAFVCMFISKVIAIIHARHQLSKLVQNIENKIITN